MMKISCHEKDMLPHYISHLKPGSRLRLRRSFSRQISKLKLRDPLKLNN